jgi:hypothetical protein
MASNVTHTIKFRVYEVERGLLVEPDRMSFYNEHPFRYPFDTQQEALDKLKSEEMHGEFVILPVTDCNVEY